MTDLKMILDEIKFTIMNKDGSYMTQEEYEIMEKEKNQ